jgi:excisionase family DNA binding protein
MNATTLQQAQAQMRLEHQPQAVAERFGPAPVSDIMTVKEAAQYLRVSVSQMYTLTRHSGVVRAIVPIPAIRFGKSLKFRRSSLDKWLTELEKRAG